MIDSIWTMMLSLRIQDIFDIAIISVMISALLIWFKDRASRFVLLGISLLGFIYVVAKFFQLYLTTVVLQGFFAILLFVLVVIFQEDLRRFFERLAIMGIIRKKFQNTTPYGQTAEVIAQTAASLARKHVGALIVIQGNDPLGRHLSGGTELNGLLSEPLLESIFDPHSIGHDGAVVVDGNTVVRFGCHLPLSQNTNRYGFWGLRHTAALGLSERSDAVCIVVSEERGTISIAQGEQLKELASASALKGILESFYNSKAPVKKPGPISLWLKENTKEKVIAILLACILWMIFGYQKESIQKDFTVPVEYLNVPAAWIIEEPKITEAKVMMAGPSQAFQLLNADTLKISLNLSQLQEGRQEIMLTKEMINTPSNLTVVGIKPSRITVNTSRFIRVTVPIEVVTENAPAAGVTIQKITVTPSSIKILIPSKLYRDKMKIQTAPIDLRQITSTTTLAPKLSVPPDVHFEGGSEPAVKVIVRAKK
ncbi:MAG TPA: diadenylate cyclase [Syntrophales bacterium]|nr:diadenylate cyclase [Syntrophales bacterium]